MRFEVEGPWQHGDALKLAYFIKAAVSRVREDHVLVDLRRVKTPPDAQGKFLICDRLRRALNPKFRIGVLSSAEWIDADPMPANMPHCPDIALFGAETDALHWLARDGSRHPAVQPPPQ